MERCASCRALECENRMLQRQVARLERENAALEEKNASLQAALEKSRRDGKRQAAPFSKGKPKENPRRPGRRSGKAHGRHGHRPRPTWIDETLEAPLPSSCPHCGGSAIEETGVAEQFQTEIPRVKPHVTRFNVHIGSCADCGRRIQGRHPHQTSNALGAAASQLGPQAMSLAAELHKELGVSLGKVRRLFDHSFGLSVTCGGLYHATRRVARVAQPTYHALVERIRCAPVVAADETGWKVGGWLQWLWVFVSPEATVYAIQPGRGFTEAAAVLGEDFAGILLRDGWAPYRLFVQAEHQSCLNHLIHRCHENLETAVRGTARIPHAVLRLLSKGLDLRDRRDHGELSPHGLAVATGRLRAAMDRLLDWRPTDEENRKLLKHLGNERDALFTFLHVPGLPATNWPGEQAVRPAVANRKVCGGNRTWLGARIQHIIMSLFRTSRQRRHDPREIITTLLRSPVPIVAESLLPQNDRSPPSSP
ncbi:MAG: IS66 family transposase [Chromatiaceae bacterium]